MMLKFNIAGPCFPNEHYMLPPMERLPEVMHLVEGREYFVLHSARQSGKTTVMQTFVDAINEKGDAAAFYFSVEAAQQYANPSEGIGKIVDAMISDLRYSGNNSKIAEELTAAKAGFIDLKGAVSVMARAVGKPLVIFFDEVDALSDATLITFLRELRSGYVTRNRIPFAASIALISMRNIRDYKAKVRPEGATLGCASPFNIITGDLTLANFTRDDIARLYAQHTAATGQVFEDGAVDAAYALTCGQPWLVNALARECVANIHRFRYGEAITAADMETAKETIIRARGTHIDSLMERLKEERVRRIVEPVIMGEMCVSPRNNDDYRYVLDLGILKEDVFGGLVPANPMYCEIILRYLSHDEQETFKMTYRTPFWLRDDGSLDMPGLMREFQRFWRENASASHEVYGYHEAMPHLVIMAFLQRVVNGGGRILREMALGSKRLDLCVEYGRFRYAVELKMKRNYTPEKSPVQLAGYLDALGLAEGWMPVFDEDASKPWEEKIFTKDVTVSGKTIHVIGL